MELRQANLAKLLESNPLTTGMYVRVYGDHLIVGRQQPYGPAGELEPDDRVRLTCLNRTSYGLSVKRHTGRWQNTPFTGTLDEVVEVIWTLMQHLVASYP